MQMSKHKASSQQFTQICNRNTEFQGNVYMYYKLYGFHQHLYRYILSRSNSQLVGTDIKVKELYSVMIVGAKFALLKKNNSPTHICLFSSQESISLL
ncbi:Cell Cycle Control Protein 50A [Manis pentadactyla]|nr:Cell Cycle Control Protein 50A [Manis pentadactyla]